MNIGDKVKFCDEAQRYTVQYLDDDFVILTKPFNARKTYLYTIVDLKGKVRGHFGRWGPPNDCDTPEGAAECMRMHREDGHSLAERNFIPLTDKEIDVLIRSKPT